MSAQQPKSFALIDKFIAQQIETLRTPLHLTKDITDQIRSTNNNPTLTKRTQHKKLKLEDTPRILESINTKLRRHVHDYFSKQSVAQLLDQIRVLRDENAEKRVTALKSLDSLQLQFVDLDTKNYSLDTLLEKIHELPVIKAGDSTNYHEDSVQKYNDLVSTLKSRTIQLETIKEKRENMKKDSDLLKDKLIGDSTFEENVLQNIPLNSETSEINSEIVKLKTLVNRLINDTMIDPNKKELIIKYLNLSQEELDELLVLQ
ncbi:hypothetical protein WICPIJ_007991 [Wickerhamomyces pijperi]|uniref:Uncharacterized protein n=1 Tax=Wickerhamomyces pijperi TaxID=599730 RepID=A0A9P8Q1I1_WICPI|nr:hypothetical protein WICPIJ_007991 [Wickerhamomyces pijperi]